MLQSVLLRRRSVILTWMLSYCAILLLPLIISVFVYVVSSKMLESEIHQASRSLLSQVREVSDGYIQSMERLNFELTWNVKVQELLYSNKYSSFPQEYNYDRYRIAKDFAQYQSAYTPIDLFYLYLKKDNSVILPSIVRDGPYAYQLLHDDGAFTYDKWSSIVNQNRFNGFVPMVRMTDDGQLQKTLALVTTYKSDKAESPATNVVMIDQSRILGAIRNVKLFNKGQVFIADEHNRVLVSDTGEETPVPIPFDRMREQDGLFYFTEGGHKFELVYMKSPRTNFTYVSMIPSSLYWQKAKLVRNLMVASSLISLLGGGLLTLFFLRRNYNPVRRLVQAFSGKSGIVGNAKEGNEFQFIQQAVDHTLGKMDSILLQMEQQRHVLRSNFIARLLKGRLDRSIPIDESLAAFDMRFNSDDFAVILLYAESGEPFYNRIAGMESSDKRKLLLFIVTNVMEELAAGQNMGYVTEMDEAFACLINFRQLDETERQAELRRIALEAQRFLAEHYHLQFTFSISGIHCGVPSIVETYQEALDAMEYKFVMGTKEILAYGDIQRHAREENGPGYYYPLQVEQQLINYMKAGDFDKAKGTLDDIMKENFHCPAVPVAFARCLMFNLVGTMAKTVGEIGSVQDSFLVQNPKQIERFMACQTIHDMREQLSDFLKTVCEYTSERRRQQLQNSRQQALGELIRNVVDFIDRTFMDPNLNISMIGSHFDMKPAYLSKLFKDQTGEGLLDYINKTRIAKAKDMIGASRKNINDVYASIGFNDVNAFIRTFKKYEGITPGKYKEMTAD